MLLSEIFTSREKCLGAPRKIIAVTIFPGTLTAAVLCCYYLQLQGIKPGVALIGTILMAVVLIIVMEQLTPEQAKWNQSHNDTAADIGHTVIAFAVGGSFFAMIFTTGTFLSEQLSVWLGVTPWPTSWWLPFQVVLTLVLAEFGPYWVHKISTPVASMAVPCHTPQRTPNVLVEHLSIPYHRFAAHQFPEVSSAYISRRYSSGFSLLPCDRLHRCLLPTQQCQGESRTTELVFLNT